MNELSFRDVSVRFGGRRRGVTAVDRVDLTVPAGSVVGLVGESGSGKSTLARAAVGLAPLAGGDIRLDGRTLPRTPGTGAGRRVQMVFQDPYSSLDPRMRIGASIAEAIPRGATPAARRAEVLRLLELVELAPERAGQYPVQLSGGQRQRVALARALAARPDVIIADEITSALDVSIQGTVLNLVRDLQRRLGLSMLFISHNLAVVRYVSDVLAVMYLGRIVECGPVDDVLGDPQHPYTRQLLASAPRPGATRQAVTGTEAVLDAAEPADPHHPPTGCHFHPRCPVGPLVLQRDTCRDTEPDGAAHRHRAACHFAAPATSPMRSTP
jgi:peptide/nickel transport system ATP-binding protein